MKPEEIPLLELLETAAMIFSLGTLAALFGFVGWILFAHDPYIAGDDGEDY